MPDLTASPMRWTWRAAAPNPDPSPDALAEIVYEILDNGTPRLWCGNTSIAMRTALALNALDGVFVAVEARAVTQLSTPLN